MAPTISVSSGPTTVPQRVTQASSVPPRQLIRFITLTSGSLTISRIFERMNSDTVSLARRSTALSAEENVELLLRALRLAQLGLEVQVSDNSGLLSEANGLRDELKVGGW